MAKYYLVGGAVRDSFLGKNSKDRDYAVEAESFDAMRQDILRKGGKIFLEKPEFQTIRARFGRDTSDYVLCRKDGAYSDGRHPDEVSVGTIADDLARRDFTMNAIATAEDGSTIDPFGGRADIDNKMIRCVGKADERFGEDALRMLRAIRFSITLGFSMSIEIWSYLKRRGHELSSVSEERIREELLKCFSANTPATLSVLSQCYGISEFVFGGKTKIWLKPTNEER